VTTKIFFTVGYDLPSEMQKVFQAKPGDTPVEALVRRNLRVKMYGLRRNFAEAMSRHGTFISRSLFVVPPEHIEEVEKVIADYEGRYLTLPQSVGGVGVHTTPNIRVLRFHPADNDKIQAGARAVLTEALNKVLDDLDVRILAAQEAGDLHVRTFRKLAGEVGVLERLATAFEVSAEADMANLLKQADVKLRMLGDYT
jgi:hypothetical protein